MLKVDILNDIVVTCGFPRKCDFSVFARSVVAHDTPVSDCDGNAKEEEEKPVGIKTSAADEG
jgi:hypothetical protein